MSDIRDPDRDQVAPVHNDNPSCHDLVMADIAERKEHGLRKYGTILQAGNGRSFLQDAYEEALDLCMYLRGALEEERMTKQLHQLALARFRAGMDFDSDTSGHVFGTIPVGPLYEYKIPICPECEAGKHQNCTGEAWDNEKDTTTVCGCTHD